MKFLIAVLFLASFSAASAQYTEAKIKNSELSVGFSALVADGANKVANIALQNDSKATVKKLVVTLRVKFEQNNKGKTQAGENTEIVEIPMLKPGATFTKKVSYAAQIIKLTDVSVESILQKK